MATTTTARIMAPTGNLSALTVIERDDWNGGRCVIFTRDAWEDAKQRAELANPGVYVLISGDSAYVGEGDPVIERLRSHNLTRHFWSRAFALTSQAGQLNKAHVQYLEAKLCGVLGERFSLENKNTPALPALSEFDLVWATQALASAIDMLKCFGFIKALRPTIETTTANSAELQQPWSPPVSPPEVQVIQRILGMPCSGAATVGDILRLCSRGQLEFGGRLEAVGLKFVPGLGLQIPAGINAPRQLDALFRATLMANGTWQKLLMQLEGAKYTQPRFSGKKMRAICIPCSIVDT